MSNYFYTQVDANLQAELDARGRSGFSRTTNDLDYMLSKIANVELIAYSGDNTLPENAIATLGGTTTREQRFQPSGPNGFLSNPTYKKPIVKYYESTTDPAFTSRRNSSDAPRVGYAYDDFKEFNDDSRRIGPYITGVDVTVGDHSMALLNKATVKFVVSSIERDLDEVEKVWFRPGRFCKLVIVHPDSAIVSNNSNLTDSTLPSPERLKNIYGEDWPIDDFLADVGQMNKFSFEGLITSFDFSYGEDGTVDATLSLQGRSAIFADVTMLSKPDTEEKEDPAAPTVDIDPSLGQEIKYDKPPPVIQPFTPNEALINSIPKSTALQTLISALPAASQSIVNNAFRYRESVSIISASFGTAGVEKYDEWADKVDEEYNLQYTDYNNNSNSKIQAYESEKAAALRDQQVNLINQFSYKLNDFIWKQVQTAFLNENVPFDKQDGKNIICNVSKIKDRTDLWILQGTPYNITSAPVATNQQLIDADGNLVFEDILDLDGNVIGQEPVIDAFTTEDGVTSWPVMQETYITLALFVSRVNKLIQEKLGTTKTVVIKFDEVLSLSNYHPGLVSCIPEEILLLPEDFSTPGSMNSYGSTLFFKTIDYQANGKWPGVFEITPEQSVIYPSRILINTSLINRVTNQLIRSGTGKFKVKNFISSICGRIKYATGGAIDLKLISHPDDVNQFILADTKYVSPNLPNKRRKTVEPYSIPMFSNHPNGTIVHSFNMSAKLPTSAKNLAFVLNTSTEISESELAPFLNYMYTTGGGNAKEINALKDRFAAKYQNVQIKLDAAKQNYGKQPGMIQEVVDALHNQLVEYMKFPTTDLRSSQQLIAPVFSFETSFTIDGINGLRFGDVIQFDALPTRYRVNTVFSVGQITHTVDSSGVWTTDVKAFMRSRLGGDGNA